MLFFLLLKLPVSAGPASDRHVPTQLLALVCVHLVQGAPLLAVLRAQRDVVPLGALDQGCQEAALASHGAVAATVGAAQQFYLR